MDNDFQSSPGVVPKVAVPNNGRLIRNLAMGSNYLMSHILHFYHLLALDFVDVNGTGLIPKGFLCPNYDNNYYARGIDPVLQTGGLGAPAYTVNALHGPGTIPAGVLGDLTPYLAGQYVRALKIRRMAQQLGAIFAGKMPHASCYTPGCVTTKAYNPSPTGPDAAVVQKVHELLYGGPGFDPTSPGSLSPANPHPESILGFIGKPSDFWSWAAAGFSPSDLPVWAKLGVPGASSGLGASYTGTYCFDTVAAAHCFPEYFWIGSGYGRYLAWGIFEGATAEHANEWGAGLLPHPDGRLNTRRRVHIPQNPNGSGTPYTFAQYVANHKKVKEYTKSSWYDDPKGIDYGRHPWAGKTRPNTAKLGAYSFGKSPRYFWSVSEGGPDDWVPYEVGPLARMMANAAYLSTPGGPATVGEVLAVDAGSRMAYYPGILAHVDSVLAPLGSPIGVFPGWGTNLAAHITFLQTAVPGSPVFYLPPNAMSALLLGNQFHGDYMGDAVLDRVAARTLETYYVARNMLSWFNAINPSAPSNTTLYFSWGNKTDRTSPRKSKGAGLTEAPRGALGHWIKVGKRRTAPTYMKFRGRVANYQIITPTAWNISPKDHNGQMGPMERSIWGTPLVSEQEPLEILRVIHSFDPCCACTVHLMNPKKEKVAETTIDPSL